MLKTNSHIIKLSGSAFIEQPLEENSRYAVALEADLTSIERRTNEDDKINIFYKLKCDGIAQIVDKRGKKIKPKKGKSLSQELRFELMKFWEENYSGDKDFDGFYRESMFKISEQVKEQRYYLNHKYG